MIFRYNENSKITEIAILRLLNNIKGKSTLMTKLNSTSEGFKGIKSALDSLQRRKIINYKVSAVDIQIIDAENGNSKLDSIEDFFEIKFDKKLIQKELIKISFKNKN